MKTDIFLSKLTGPAWHEASWQRQPAKATLVLALLLALFVLALVSPGRTHAQDTWPSVGGTTTAVNDGPGDQFHADISDTLVAYSSILPSGYVEVRYYNLLTGIDSGIPNGGGLDYLPHIDGSMIVYTHVTDDAYEIYAFDTAGAGSPTGLDAQPGSLREKAEIGGQIVAWMDYGLNGEPLSSEIVVYDLASGTVTRLTNDLLYDTNPVVSSDGSMVVWSKCRNYESDCRIWQAANNDGQWSAAQLSGDVERSHPAIDDQYIVYQGTDANGESDIYWRRRDGGEEHRLALPNPQQRPAISNGVIVFESHNVTHPTPNWDILLYDIATGAGYQVAASTTDDEVLSDIAVNPDGLIRVAWTREDPTDYNLYTRAFHLPSGDRTPPGIVINAPLNATYTPNQVVLADYSCADESGGSGIAACDGPVASGSAIDTASVGSKTFTVVAIDNAGNTASQSVNYTVTYNICPLYDEDKAHKLGSTVPIKLQLHDADGANVSAEEVVVHASSLIRLENTTTGDLVDSGNANPDHDFRYSSTLGGGGGYIYNLSTKGLSTGIWELNFTAGDDPIVHTVQFGLR